ncbi:undecaprenyl-diphosphatase [Modestobacter sp. DSM 44400]|uniref:phosphatase PAP2 family protein n=1 Tax=Modestobacter sp. DSM 44400 TaxID=1550230 RepID=UPI00089B34E3|nr:phosphatase PAP2 family protein [Modestobacter sp. DSM 44400]SDX80791.1 undecaprenyl-diphosphatase [Modestobacter sp. DSM 44400]
MDTLTHVDDSLLADVNAFARHTGWLHGPLLGYATYGIVVFAVLLLSAMLVSRTGPSRSLAAAGWACLATLVAVGVNQPVGHLFGEARPFTTHPELLILASRTSDFSFPSDHAVMAGAAAAGCWLVSRRLGWVATAAAVVMAFARVYIAAHYPWDVVAGLLLGAMVTLLGWWLFRGPLIAVTGWLRHRPLLRTVFPEPTSAQVTAGRDATPVGTRT